MSPLDGTDSALWVKSSIPPQVANIESRVHVFSVSVMATGATLMNTDDSALVFEEVLIFGLRLAGNSLTTLDLLTTIDMELKLLEIDGHYHCTEQ